MKDFFKKLCGTIGCFIPIAVFVGLIIWGVVTGISDFRKSQDIECDDSYIEGYDDGYSEGYDEGWSEGFDYGYNEAFIWAEDENSDNNDGYEEGYDDGYSEGYYAGATYTCLYFGDVDRAFQCANNGCVWYTFLDAYDQYVSNIFDDDETRSELFWAIISATLGDDVTKEEKELLISTFGEEMFIRNGLNFSP